MKPETWTFPESDTPAGELWLPDAGVDPSAPVPGVILAPDLLGRAGRGLPTALAAELARRGYVALTADASSGCESPRFKEATLRERTGDLARAVTALFERMVAGGSVDIRRLAVVGHGVGGTAAVTEAAHDSRVGAVAAIAAPRTASGFFPGRMIEVWQKGTTAKVKDPSTGEEHELGPELFRDWKAREAELDHATRARETGGHVLWVHGTEDEAVNVEDSRRAYWKHPDAGRRARLVEIAGAAHDFGVAADLPFDRDRELAPHARKLADAVQELLEAAFPKKA
jgi:dienelactone hydrolase